MLKFFQYSKEFKKKSIITNYIINRALGFYIFANHFYRDLKHRLFFLILHM
jgi:hypothetical protein